MGIMSSAVLAQAAEDGGSLLALIPVLMVLALNLVVIVGAWKAFAKAGEPGWAILVPFYNLYVFLKIAGRPDWWIVLMLIPFVNVIVGFIAAIDFAKAYGKGAGFGVGVAFLGAIFIPILGFGEARYQGAAA